MYVFFSREVAGSVDTQGSVVSVAKRQTFLQTVNAQLAYAVDVLISFLHYGEQLAQQALFGLANGKRFWFLSCVGVPVCVCVCVCLVSLSELNPFAAMYDQN